MGREFELKFRADAAVIEKIREKYGCFTPIPMETTYYDTFDLKLAFHHWTLRRRMENGVSVCTFKCPRADGSRGEWEVEAPNITEGILQLCQAGADWELDKEYFHQLGDAGVEDAVLLAKDESVNTETRKGAKSFLNDMEKWELNEEPSLAEYSFSRIRAQRAIENR